MVALAGTSGGAGTAASLATAGTRSATTLERRRGEDAALLLLRGDGILRQRLVGARVFLSAIGLGAAAAPGQRAQRRRRPK